MALRGRIVLAVLSAVLLLAVVSAVVIEAVMEDALEQAAVSEGLTIARSFSASAIDAVLLGDRLDLNALMRRTMAAERDIAYIFVVDRNGEVVSSTFSDGMPPALLDVNNPARADEHTTQLLNTGEGRVLDIAMNMLSGDAGVAHVGLSESHLEAALAQTRWILLGVTAGMVAIGLLVSFGSGRIIAQPLEALATTAARVQAGDLSVRAELDGDSEVAHVADAINSMLTALQMDIARREAVEAELQQSHAQLETRVVERTAELADANEELTSMNEELAGMNEEFAASNDDLAAANEQLEQASRLIAEATRVKSEFLAAMSHELRTPLNSVIGFSDIMLREMAGPVTDEQRRQLEMVKSSGSYLLTLINDILDLSRIDAGHLEPVISTVDLRIVTERAFTAFRSPGEAKGLVMTFRADGEACKVRTDPMRLEQVLVNVLGNAVKFTEVGEIELCVVCADAGAEIRVRDTGPGIAPADLARVFEEFYQVRDPDGVHAAGTGLGLAISSRIMDALGGTLGARSEAGHGSTFIVRLPLADSGAA